MSDFGGGVQGTRGSLALSHKEQTDWLLTLQRAGWEEKYSKQEGRVYYYHRASEKTQWEPPQIETATRGRGGAGGVRTEERSTALAGRV